MNLDVERRSAVRTFCEVGDCLERAVRGGLCWRHYNRAKGRASAPVPAGEPARTPRERVVMVALRLADVSAERDNEFDAAERALRRACEAWLRGRGWKPPR